MCNSCVVKLCKLCFKLRANSLGKLQFAGYLGSALMGALLLFFGFSTLASKIAAGCIAGACAGLSMGYKHQRDPWLFHVMSSKPKQECAPSAGLLVLVLVWAKTWFTRGMALLFIALIIACYFMPDPAGAWVMRLFILFLGCGAPRSGGGMHATSCPHPAGRWVRRLRMLSEGCDTSVPSFIVFGSPGIVEDACTLRVLACAVKLHATPMLSSMHGPHGCVRPACCSTRYERTLKP